jgi:cytochrome c oxidase subunit 2
MTRFPSAVRALRPALFVFLAAAALPASASALPFWLRLPEQASTYAHEIDGMFHLIMWITGIIFVIVEGLLLYFLWKYRHREGRQAHYTHGNNRLEVIWTIVPALICVMLALMSRRIWTNIKEKMPEGALQVQIQGEQFAWNFKYAGADGQFDTPDDIITLNQLHFPVGKPVVATLSSKDVIHSFYLPEFRVKQDAVPGLKTRIWFEGNRVGSWDIACAELCGLGHFRMKGFVTVDTPEDFEKWLAEQAAAQAGEQPQAAPAADAAPAAAPDTVAPAAAPAANQASAEGAKGGHS